MQGAGLPQASDGPSVPAVPCGRARTPSQQLRTRLARAEREAAAHQRQLERYAADLRESYRRERARAQQLRRSYKATVRALSNAVEARDAYTGKHAERVAAYGLAHRAAPPGIDVADEPQIEFGFLLHDIGKVGVPDAILFKPARCREDEFALHRRATPRSARRSCATSTSSTRRRWSSATTTSAGTARGYPDGLEGDADPARGARVRGRRHARRADDRPPYRAARRLREARAEIHAARARSSTRRGRRLRHDRRRAFARLRRRRARPQRAADRA